MRRTNLLRFALVLVPALALAQQTLKVNVDLVNVFVSVQDERGEFVTGLKQSDFVVYEDDKPQDVVAFEKEGDVRSVLGLLMDTSGSMVDILPYMNRGVTDFSATIRQPDEYFVMTFGTNVRMVHRSPDTAQHLEQVLRELKPFGTSVLFDAMMSGMERATSSSNERKALIAFTDGNDNGSKMEYGRVAQEAQRSGVLCYFVAIGSPILVDRHTLEALSGNSGGRVFYVPKAESVIPYLQKIRNELSRQYYAGYYASRSKGFHKIRVEIPGRPNLRIHAKSGYLVN